MPMQLADAHKALAIGSMVGLDALGPPQRSMMPMPMPMMMRPPGQGLEMAPAGPMGSYPASGMMTQPMGGYGGGYGMAAVGGHMMHPGSGAPPLYGYPNGALFPPQPHARW